MKELTQQERIINLLQDRKEHGAFVYEFMMPRPQGLGIAQYNARIKELREQGHNIECVTPGHFVLKPSPVRTTDQEMKEWIDKRVEEGNREERVDAGLEPQISLF